MNVKFNTLAFKGKEEILYGLKMAAENAKTMEICTNQLKGPRPLFSRIETRTIAEASMSAYTDMIVRDKDFVTSITNFTKNDLKNIKNILDNKEEKHTVVNAFDILKNTILKAFINNSDAKEINSTEPVLQSFFDKLA